MLLTTRNVTTATTQLLKELFLKGAPTISRVANTLELRNCQITFTHPQERCLFLKNRGNSIVATLAEVIWVTAGRQDVAWLSRYLRRAADFSDDSKTWRAAYPSTNCYQYNIRPAAIALPHNMLDSALRQWFAIEDVWHTNPDESLSTSEIPSDDFLKSAAVIVRAHNGIQRGWAAPNVQQLLSTLPENDLTAAAYELFSRQYPELIDSCSQANIRAFLQHYYS